MFGRHGNKYDGRYVGFAIWYKRIGYTSQPSYGISYFLKQRQRELLIQTGATITRSPQNKMVVGGACDDTEGEGDKGLGFGIEKFSCNSFSRIKIKIEWRLLGS
jgi:hypothetical protein